MEEEIINNLELDKKFHFLLADDDIDDRYFFEKAVRKLHPETSFSFVEDGEKLMQFLGDNMDGLPDILFLDLNMPRKNGSECLSTIKNNDKLRQLAVIIYSTSNHPDVADLLYNTGAHYFIKKPDLPQLEKLLQYILSLLIEKKFGRPERDKFILDLVSKKRVNF